MRPRKPPETGPSPIFETHPRFQRARANLAAKTNGESAGVHPTLYRDSSTEADAGPRRTRQSSAEFVSPLASFSPKRPPKASISPLESPSRMSEPKEEQLRAPPSPLRHEASSPETKKSAKIVVQKSAEAEPPNVKLEHLPRQDSVGVPEPGPRGGSSSQIRLEALRSNKVCAIFLLPYAVLFLALVFDLTEPLRLTAWKLPDSKMCTVPKEAHATPIACVETPRVEQLTNETFVATTTWSTEVGDVGPTSFFLLERLPVVAYPDDKGTKGNASEKGDIEGAGLGGQKEWSSDHTSRPTPAPTRSPLLSKDFFLRAETTTWTALYAPLKDTTTTMLLTNATTATLPCRLYLRGPMTDKNPHQAFINALENLVSSGGNVADPGGGGDLAYSCGGVVLSSFPLDDLQGNDVMRMKGLRVDVHYSVLMGGRKAENDPQESLNYSQDDTHILASIMAEIIKGGKHQLVYERAEYGLCEAVFRTCAWLVLFFLAVVWLRHLRGSWKPPKVSTRDQGIADESTPLLSSEPTHATEHSASTVDGVFLFRAERALLCLGLLAAMLWIDPCRASPDYLASAFAATLSKDSQPSNEDLEGNSTRESVPGWQRAVASRVCVVLGAQVLLFATLCLLDGLRYKRGLKTLSSGRKVLVYPPHDIFASQGLLCDFYAPKMFILIVGVFLGVSAAVLRVLGADALVIGFTHEEQYESYAKANSSRYYWYNSGAAGFSILQELVLLFIWVGALFSAMRSTQKSLRRRRYATSRAQQLSFRMIELCLSGVMIYGLCRFFFACFLYARVLRELAPKNVQDIYADSKGGFDIVGVGSAFWNVLMPYFRGGSPAAHLEAAGSGSFPGIQLLVTVALALLLWVHSLPPVLESTDDKAQTHEDVEWHGAQNVTGTPENKSGSIKVYCAGWVTLETYLGGVVSDIPSECMAPNWTGVHVLCLETAYWLCEVSWQAYYNFNPSPGQEPLQPGQRPSYWHLRLTPPNRYKVSLAPLGLNLTLPITCEEFDLSGFLARGRGRWVLSFRGSVSSTNLLTDLTMSRSPLRDHLSGVTFGLAYAGSEGRKRSNRRLRAMYDRSLVHTGFITAYMKIRAQVRRALELVGSDPDGLPLYICGHSLGAALACLAALEASLSLSGDHVLQKMIGPIPEEPRGLSDSNLAAKLEQNEVERGTPSPYEAAAGHFDANGKFLRRITPVLYTFATPRVGDASFAKLLDRMVPCHFRIVTDGDPVPQQPPTPWFHHAGVEVLLDAATGDILLDPSPVDRLLRNRVAVQMQSQSYLHGMNAYLDGLGGAMSMDDYRYMVRRGLLRGSVETFRQVPDWIRKEIEDLEV